MKNIKLFIFDIDNTITTGTSIWELMHLECNTWQDKGLTYLEQFSRGEIDFDNFARLDAAAWKNQPLAKLHDAIGKIKITPGFSELISNLKNKHITTGIVSCSIGQFAEHLAETFSIKYVFANRLEITDNHLNGNIDITVKGTAKADIAKKLIDSLNLNRDQVAIVGDSHFDLPMFEHTNHSFIINNEKYKNIARYFVKDFHEINSLL